MQLCSNDAAFFFGFVISVLLWINIFMQENRQIRQVRISALAEVLSITGNAHQTAPFSDS
jgi:hypothetical protein